MRTDRFYEVLANAYYGANREDEFITKLKDDKYFSDRRDQKAHLYNYLGNLCKGDSRFESAVEYYMKAVQISPDVPLYQWSVGDVARMTGDNETMMYRYRKAVELRKKYEADTFDLEFYYNNLADGYYYAGIPDEFFKLLESSDRQGKQNGWNLSTFKIIKRRFLNLFKFDRTVPRNEKKARYYNRMGNLFFGSQSYDTAVRYYNNAIAYDPMVPIYHCNLGRAHGNLGNMTKMEESCRKAIEYRYRTPEDIYELDYYYEFLTVALYKLGKIPQLLTILNDSTGMHPTQQATLWNRTGNLYFEDGKFSEAVKYYFNAVRLDAKNPVYHGNIGRAYGENGEPAKMLEHCKRGLMLYRISGRGESTFDYYIQYLGVAYCKNGRVADFEDELKSMRYCDDLTTQAKAAAYNGIGNEFFQSEDFNGAIRYYQKAVHQSPETPVYQCNLGRAYGNVGDYKRMKEYCRNAVELRKKLTSDDYDLHYYYQYTAEAYTRERRLDVFLEYFSAEEEPSITDAHRARVMNYIGHILINLLDPITAATFYKKAIEYDPGMPIYYCNLGITLGDLDDTDGMIEHCRRGVELRKTVSYDEYGQEFYYSHLITAYDRAGKLDEIVHEFKSNPDVVEEPYARALLFNSIGNLYFERGAWKKAVDCYTAAVELENKHPTFLCNLGRAYGEMNKPDRMIDYCVRALRRRQEGERDDYDVTEYYAFVLYAYRRAGKIGEFITTFQHELEDENNENVGAFVFNLIGHIFYDIRQYNRALEYYKKCLARAPLEPEYHLNCARSLFGVGRHDEALTAAKRALELRRKQIGYHITEDEFIFVLNELQIPVSSTP